MPAHTLNQDTLLLGYMDFNQNEGRNLRLHQLGSDPGSPVNGQILYRTDTHKIRARINGAWQDLATMADVTAGGISSTIVDAKGDLIVATAADTVARYAVGSNGQVDFANSATASGHEWRDFTETDIKGITTDRLLGRDTAGTGAAEELALDSTLVFTGAPGIGRAAITGDVAISAGANAATIPNDTVTNAKAANMPANTIKGNNTGGSADPADLTVANVKTMLAYAASEVAVTPFGNVVATNVQTALQELETDLTALISSTIEARTWKDPVDAATTGALPNTPTYNAGAGTLTAGANAAFPTVDGVAAAVGNRYLVKDQASTFQNGIYTLTTLGSGAAAWVLTRVAEGSTAAELTDATVMVDADPSVATNHGGDIFTQVNTLADLTSAAQSWVKTGNANTTYTADGTTIELVGNSFRIAAGAAGNGLTGGGGSPLAVGVTAPITVAADAIALDLTTQVGRVARVSDGVLTGGANSEVITHHSCGKKLLLSLANNASPFDEVGVHHERTSATTTTLYAASGQNLPAGYVWTVVG